MTTAPSLLQPGRVALMFALGGLAGVAGAIGGLFLGPIALIVIPGGFFIGGAMASRSLRTGSLGEISFGVAFLVGGVASFLPIVGTQGMTGNETPLYLTGVFVSSFAGGWGTAGLIALVPILGRIGFYVVGLGLVGFAGGGAVGGLIVALSAASGFSFFWVAITVGLVIPPATGGGVVAWALNSRGSGSTSAG